MIYLPESYILRMLLTTPHLSECLGKIVWKNVHDSVVTHGHYSSQVSCDEGLWRPILQIIKLI